MGMDLSPLNPTDKYPVDANGEIIWGRFSWHGWGIFGDFLESHGVNTSEMAGTNDGDILSEETCKVFAYVIEQNLDDFIAAFDMEDNSEVRAWMQKVITQFNECGGFEQW